jgi:hypothetical protein
LQLQYGYERGVLSPVALLGLFGEAGEVLNEVLFLQHIDMHPLTRAQRAAIATAEIVDEWKKVIRSSPHLAPTVYIQKEEFDGGNSFDIEVADLLYYINLVALGRGRDLSYYAELSCRKVIAKSLNSASDE